MRLTLRTLLAYLDDTLTPEETRIIGQKVAESKVAQELIERIKKVTRRRRLAPPTYSGEDLTTDPNSIAEYLENRLPADQIEALEQTALDNDANLAEISACHQILTLVLGEPMKVPPTARQRMYRLVRGKESIPYRKPTVGSVTDKIEIEDDDLRNEGDEALLLGLPQYSRKQSFSQNLIPIGGVFVIAIALVVCIIFALPTKAPMQRDPARTQLALNLPSNKKDPNTEIKDPVKGRKEDPKFQGLSGNSESTKEPSVDPKKDERKMGELVIIPRELEPEIAKKEEEAKKEEVAKKEVVKKDPLVVQANKPDPDRKVVGTSESTNAILVAREEGKSNWQRITLQGARVWSTDTLVALPGTRAELKLDAGVRLNLFGNTPEYLDLPLLESRVILYNPPRDFDADFTLESGRVFITNRKIPPGPAKVRIRVKTEIWDVALLDDKTEICVDLFGRYPGGVPFSKDPGGESPQADFYLALLKGKAGVKYGFNEYPQLDGQKYFVWDNKGPGASQPLAIDPKALEFWRRTPPKSSPVSKEMDEAISSLSKRLTRESNLDVEFGSSVKAEDEKMGSRVLAVYCLQAIDSVGYLADALSDDQYPVRTTAILAAKHWTGGAAERDLLLYKELMEKKRYPEIHADQVMQLLHGFRGEQATDPATVELLFDLMNHERISIRELAFFYLVRFDQTGAKEVGGFAAEAPANIREGTIQKWKASWKKRNIDMKK